MSSTVESICEQYIKPLPREQQLLLLVVLRNELDSAAGTSKPRSILDLHGLGKEIWQDVNPQEYVHLWSRCRRQP